MPKKVLMLGAFDTKGPDFAFLRDRLLELGVEVLSANFGVLGSTELFPVEFDAASVARAGGIDLEALREDRDRGRAMKAMVLAAPAFTRGLFEQGGFDGVIGMGGTGGTSIIAAAMRALPLGVPKVCVSTAAGGDVALYVGTSDIVMIPSIVDVAGVNRVSRKIYTRAAGAIAGMVKAELPAATAEKPVIVASMFGNTTDCVNAAAAQLEERGFEVLVFHAIGTGGRTLEALVHDGLVDGVLDITTTEWADELCGGVFTAGPDRLNAPGETGVPHLIVPGCIDMVNFAGVNGVPSAYLDAQRTIYEWNPSVALMRTNAEENAQLGRIFAEKANSAKGPVAFLIPLRGFSILGGHDQQFYDPQADQAFITELKRYLRQDISVRELDCNINDPEFSAEAVRMMLALMQH